MPTRARAVGAGGAVLALLVVLYGAGVASRGTGELRIPAAGTTSLLRAAVFTALALHLGELAGAALARTGPLPRSLALPAALAGAAASAGQIAVLAVVSDLDIPATYGTREGGLLLVMANGFLLAAACAGTGGPAGRSSRSRASSSRRRCAPTRSRTPRNWARRSRSST